MTLISLLIGIAGLHAQTDHVRLVFEDTGDTSSIALNQLETVIEDYLDAYKRDGYWNASLELLRDEANPNTLRALVDPGSIPSVQNLHFTGDGGDYWLLHQEYMLGQASIDVSKLDQAEIRVKNLGYRFKDQRQLSRDKQGAYHLDYLITDGPKVNIDALAAFNQTPTSDTLAWFGHVNLHVPNLDGKGKSLRLNWKRLKTDSEKFLIVYEHPWLLYKPLKAVFNFGREVVNGNYQLLKGKLGLEWNIDWEQTMSFEYEDHQSLITHDGALLNPDWQASRKKMLGLGYQYSNLDFEAHRGFQMRTSLFQEINFEPTSVSRLDYRSEAELGLVYKLYLSQRTDMTIQNQSSAETDPSILQPLGGVNSVRGYEENVLRSPSVLSMQNDLHLPLGNQSELIALLDVGLYYEAGQIENLTGYGLGVQMRTANGPIRIIIASHKDLGFRNSFLHIEYSGGNTWINR